MGREMVGGEGVEEVGGNDGTSSGWGGSCSFSLFPSLLCFS